MGRFGVVTAFLRALRRGGNQSDTRCDPGGGALVDAYHAQQPGDDTHPLPGDTAVLVAVERSNNYAAVGYIDPDNVQTAQQGERRLYARPAGGGAAVCEVHLFNDGRIILSNGAGSLQMLADGSVNINGAVISPSGQITDSGDIQLHGHSHTQGVDSAGDTQARTDAASQP